MNNSRRPKAVICIGKENTWRPYNYIKSVEYTRPSYRSFQVASCREGVIAETEWKRRKNCQKANKLRLLNSLDKRHICTLPSPVSLCTGNHNRRRWTPNTLCWMWMVCTTTTWNFQKLLSYTFYGGNVLRVVVHFFFTAAHFHLASVSASISHFVSAATKFSCCSSKICLLCF